MLSNIKTGKLHHCTALKGIIKEKKQGKNERQARQTDTLLILSV